MSAQRAAQLVEAGLFLRLSGDLEGAKRLFEQALRLDPTNARAKHLLEGRDPSATNTPGASRAVGGQGAVPPSVAPAPPSVAPARGGGAFDADWGQAMEGSGSGPAPNEHTPAWGVQPRTTAPAAPMGAPRTVTMAFPLNEARQLPMDRPAQAPMGAPPTSTLAYPMGEQPAPGSYQHEEAPMGAPPTSTLAYPMGEQPAPGSYQHEEAPMGAPPTSTLAYPMGPQGSPVAPEGHTGWTPPPWASDSNPPQQTGHEDAGWAPTPTTDPWGQPSPAWTQQQQQQQQQQWEQQQQQQQQQYDQQQHDQQQASGQPQWGETPAQGWDPSEQQQQQSPWETQSGNWGAPPTSGLKPAPQQPAQPTHDPNDPWTAFRISGGQQPAGDQDAAMWKVALAPPAVAPAAPPKVQPAQPPPRPVSLQPVVPPMAPARPAGQPEPVPWESNAPAPPRPRPPPVAFADWAQPTQTLEAQSGPWSSGETPVHPFPAPHAPGPGPVPGRAAPPPQPPAAVTPLAPLLSSPKSPESAARPVGGDDGDDIEVVDAEDEGMAEAMAVAYSPAPAAARKIEYATGIPDADSWGDDPAMDAVSDDVDSLDSDFSFPLRSESAPPHAPPAVAPAIPAYMPPAPPPHPNPSGPPMVTVQPALVTNAESAWDHKSNPGYKMPDMRPQKGDVFDLIQKDDQARKAVPPEPTKKEQLAALLRKAKDLIGLDDHTGAVALITQADALAPNDAEVKRLKDASEAILQRRYESKIGDLARVPRVKLKETEIIWLNLDHRAGFMLAQVDGSSTFEDLFALSGMSRLDTARILSELIDQGVIDRHS